MTHKYEGLPEIPTELASDLKQILDERGAVVALFYPGEAEGAIPNQTRVRKCNTKPGDSYPDGTEGTVLSSVDCSEDPNVPHPFAYFISWDPQPGVPVLIGGHRIKEL